MKLRNAYASITTICSRAAVATRAALLALLLGATSPAPAQTLPLDVLYSCAFASSFTACLFSEQALVPGRATIVNMGRDGATGVRLHTEPGDSNIFGSGSNERNDLQLSDSASACTQGQEAWWAHSVLFPDDYVPSPMSTGSAWNFTVVADFHQKGAAGPTLWELDAMPDTALSPDRPTGLQFVGHGGDPANPVQYGAAIGPVVKNVWYDFVYHVRWSSGADGFFYAWVNGVQKLAYTGPTLYIGDSCYLKLANYHSPTGQASSIIHDRVIRGTTPTAVALGVLEGVVMSPALDATGPTTPAGLSASAVSSSQINLSWTASTDNVGVTGYRVLLGGALLTTLGAVTSYQSIGLVPSTTYSYTVQAIDAAGNASGQSAAAIATTQAAPDVIAPSAPGGLAASAFSSSQINLSWAASTDNVGVTGYRIFRGGALLTTLGAVTSYQSTGLAASTTYSYSVQAIDAAGNASAQSAPASATTQAAPDIVAPSTPTGLTARAVTPTQIQLSWNVSSDNIGVTGYTVYLNDVALANITTRSFRHSGLTPGSTYSYRVSAFDAARNNSAWTTPAISVKTPGRRMLGSDFNGDGKADILWRNIATGEESIWLMNGAVISSGGTFATVADPGWIIAGTGDFDGDGKADILWRNGATGANTIWFMNAGTIATIAASAAVADLNWSIAGVGDFNGDGKADILWRNAATGDDTIWLMNGTAIAASAQFARVADPAWSIAGIGDFDGDGKSDILWRNTATGANTIWLMNGASISSAPAINGMTDLNWSIAGSGDFDGDGKSDILWHNNATGANTLWLMNGAVISGGATAFETVADLNWNIAGVGDLDGDGKSDIVWRNGATGETLVWIMNGATILSRPALNTVPDLNWSIVPR